MEKHEKTFRTYKRNHTGHYFQEQEEQKIKKGKHSYEEMLRRADMIPLDGDGDTDAQGEYDELMTALKKLKGSNKKHKKRLNELEKNDGFI